MNEEKEGTKEKILYSTLQVIEHEGINAVTVRKIANVAQVNVAAVNYHFGSKEELLEEAMEFSLFNAFKDPLLEIEQKKLDVKNAVYFLLHDWFEGMIKYPGISKAQLFKPFISNNYESLFVVKLNSFLENFISKLKENGEAFDEHKFRITIVQIISAIILPGIMPGLFSKFFKTDLTIKENREEYIQFLLDKYL